MIEVIGEEEAHQVDCITLLNCSRNKKLIQLGLEVWREGNFRHRIELDQ